MVEAIHPPENRCQTPLAGKMPRERVQIRLTAMPQKRPESSPISLNRQDAAPGQAQFHSKHQKIAPWRFNHSLAVLAPWRFDPSPASRGFGAV
jgi:hypothetical protein